MQLFQYALLVDNKSSREARYLILARDEPRASQLLHVFWEADLYDVGWTGNDWSFLDSIKDAQDFLNILQSTQEGLVFWSKEHGWRHLSPEDYLVGEWPSPC